MDIAEVGILATTLKSAGDLVTTIISLGDSTKIQNVARELNTVILAAQRSAFEAQSSQLTLLKQVGELEKQIAVIKAWETEKVRYELKDIGGRGYAYVVKAGMRGAEPPHAICANCYQHEKISFLQFNGESRVGDQAFRCPSCKTAFNFYKVSMDASLQT